MEQNEFTDIRILPDDSVQEIARKIFYGFELNQSCIVRGYVEDSKTEEVFSKGELVLKELERMDMLDNTYIASDKRPRRKRVKPPNTIGGFVAQKIFTYKQETRNSNVCISIWRTQ